MGKSKPKRRTKDRTKFTSKPPTDPELATIRTQRILPVLADLQSPDLKTRSTAAGVITDIIEDTKCRKLLLREQLVRILLEQTLTDSQLEARTAGWGILRNLALEEEADFCVHLYRQDILTAIKGAVNSVLPTLTSKDVPFSKLPQAQQKFTWDLITSVVGLISSLVEAVDEILDAVAEAPLIIGFLFGLLFSNSTPEEPQNEVLSCLITLTEDNKPLSQQIVDNAAWLKALQRYVNGSGSNVSEVTACGVLHNVFSAMQWFDHNTPVEGASDASLIPVLVQCIDAARAESNGMAEDSTNGTHSQRVLQLALEVIASIATDLQEALEHGIKHEEEFEGFDDKPAEGEDDKMEDHEDEEAEEDGNGEMDEVQMDADMDLVTGDGPEDDESTKEELTLDRLVRTATPKVLLIAKEASGDPTKAAIQSYALSALNNIAWTISSLDFSQNHLDALQTFWSTLAQQTWNEIVTPVLASNTADIELASTITSLSWALSRSVQGRLNIQPEEHRKFMALYHASKNLDSSLAEEQSSNGTKKAFSPRSPPPDAFQSLGVKALGVLGTLALSPAPLPLNREIGIFLITVLSSLPSTSAPEAVEALNQIFDIYADKSHECDEGVFWKEGFYGHLEELVPRVKKMAKGVDGRTRGELRKRADEGVVNLGRFLRYKKGEREVTGIA